MARPRVYRHVATLPSSLALLLADWPSQYCTSLY